MGNKACRFTDTSMISMISVKKCNQHVKKEKNALATACFRIMNENQSTWRSNTKMACGISKLKTNQHLQVFPLAFVYQALPFDE